MLNFSINRNSESLNISPDIYMKIIKKAIEQTSRDVEDLKQAVQDKNFDLIDSISHRLKGDYANLRIMDMSAIAKAMLEEARGERDLEKINNFFTEFAKFFDELKERISLGQ